MAYLIAASLENIFHELSLIAWKIKVEQARKMEERNYPYWDEVIDGELPF